MIDAVGARSASRRDSHQCSWCGKQTGGKGILQSPVKDSWVKLLTWIGRHR